MKTGRHQSSSSSFSLIMTSQITCNNGDQVYSIKLFGVMIEQKVDFSDHGKEKEVLEDQNHRPTTRNLIDCIDNSIFNSENMEGFEAFDNELFNLVDCRYLSNDKSRDRSHETYNKKKGVSTWSEDEHRSFLIGLRKLGKGDWRGISKSYVPSRTPTQVASHAQKYFMRRKAISDKKKHRPSLFDMIPPFNETPATPNALDLYYVPYKMNCPISRKNEQISSDQKCLAKYVTMATSYSSYQDHGYRLNSGRRTKCFAAPPPRLVAQPLAINQESSTQILRHELTQLE